MFASRAAAARDFERNQTCASGTYTTERGKELEIEYSDLSQAGCQAEDPHGALTFGAQVSLVIEGTGPIMAEVAWRQDNRVGLEFAELLPEQVFRHFMAEEWKEARDVPVVGKRTYPVRRMI